MNGNMRIRGVQYMRHGVTFWVAYDLQTEGDCPSSNLQRFFFDVMLVSR